CCLDPRTRPQPRAKLPGPCPRSLPPGPTSEAAVIPGAFAYHRPKSVSEAVTLLADLGEEARPLAGGHSLIPMMKLRLAAPEHLVGLAGNSCLPGLPRGAGENRACGVGPPTPPSPPPLS